MSSNLSQMFRATAPAGSADTAARAGEHADLNGASNREKFQQQMDSDMLKMMQDMHGPGYSGDPDIDFLTMMIPHHQGAVDMARLALLYGNDALSRTLAESIISNQATEIKAMTARLDALKQQRETGIKEFPPLSGTRGSGMP